MAVCATRWSDQSQNRAATRRADYSQKDFCLLLVFLKVGPPEGHVLLAAIPLTTHVGKKRFTARWSNAQ
jgi:hypothetical protein